MDKEQTINDIYSQLKQFQNDEWDEDLINQIKNLAETLKTYSSIDKGMVETLHSLFNTDSLLKKKACEKVMESVENGSIIVYFRSAQLFKVYKKEELINLLDGQLRTAYKNLHQSFEVVPSNSEQKIIIMGDITLVDQIDHIKKYILQFMINKGVQDFKDKDIICFKNESTNMIEIVINNYYVNNSSERNEIVQDLLKYILTMEKNTNMTRKLGYMPDCSEFDNADVVSMPSEKQLINEDKCFIEMVDRLVRNTSKCSKLIKEGNTFIVNFGNMNMTINNGGVVNNDNATHNEESDEIAQFIEYILDKKPKWYKESQWILISTLYEQFVEICNSSINKQRFSNNANHKLFSKKAQKVIKNKKGRAVLLFDFKTLEK